MAGGGKTNGTPVQIYTCNGGAAQQWTLEGSENDLHLRNVGSMKCLNVAGNASANGTKIQISDCYKSKGQSWVIQYAKPGVPLAWLERGNVNAGLTHIVFRHAGELRTRGSGWTTSPPS